MTEQVSFPTVLKVVGVVAVAFLVLGAYWLVGLWMLRESARGNHIPAAIGFPVLGIGIMTVYYYEFGGFSE